MTISTSACIPPKTTRIASSRRPMRCDPCQACRKSLREAWRSFPHERWSATELGQRPVPPAFTGSSPRKSEERWPRSGRRGERSVLILQGLRISVLSSRPPSSAPSDQSPRRFLSLSAPWSVSWDRTSMLVGGTTSSTCVVCSIHLDADAFCSIEQPLQVKARQLIAGAPSNFRGEGSDRARIVGFQARERRSVPIG